MTGIASRLDALVPVALTVCILAAAAGSSEQVDIVLAGRPARWICLGVLLALALARAAIAADTWRFGRAPALALAAFCGLALVSTAWSVNRHGTLTRAVAVTATIVAITALAGSTPSSQVLARRLLAAVLVAALVVALAGFVYWLVDPGRAVAAASTDYPARYQGIEDNPDTAPLLLAFGVPIALAGAVLERGLRRALLLVALVVLSASIVATASRGGLLGAFAGALAVAALVPLAARNRLALGGAVVVAAVVAAFVTTLPQPLAATPSATTPVRSVFARNAELVLPHNGEIGNPWWTRRSADTRRGLFKTSVRVRALRGTLDRIAGRPIVGYGFGAEQWAFVNRYYGFNSENPENGYVGILLQTGVVGLLVFLCALAVCVVPGIRAVARRGDAVGVAAAGAALTGLALGISQSFFHGPGNIAYAAFWTSLLLTATIRLRRT